MAILIMILKEKYGIMMAKKPKTCKQADTVLEVNATNLDTFIYLYLFILLFFNINVYSALPNVIWLIPLRFVFKNLAVDISSYMEASKSHIVKQ